MFPPLNYTTLATFTNYIEIIFSNVYLTLASEYLQQHLNDLQNWFELWRIKININKSVHMIFTLRPGISPPSNTN